MTDRNVNIYRTRSKTDYFKTLQKLQEQGYTCKGFGDDWHCKFTIKYWKED